MVPFIYYIPHSFVLRTRPEAGVNCEAHATGVALSRRACLALLARIVLAFAKITK